MKAFFPLNRDEDKLFGLYWCLCVPSSFIILSADCKKRCCGVCDRREIELSCNSACTLGKHREVDIDGVVTEFARLNGRRPVGANRGRSLGVGGGKGVASPADILRGVSRVPSPRGEKCLQGRLEKVKSAKRLLFDFRLAVKIFFFQLFFLFFFLGGGGGGAREGVMSIILGYKRVNVNVNVSKLLGVHFSTSILIGMST